jgi:alkyl hydroperoxide reductase subunit AhpC
VPAFDLDREKFAALDAQVLDISTDSILSHAAWQKQELGMMHIPMCSDFYPHGAVTRAYGILREGPPVAGISERAVFIVDKSGQIAFARVYRLDQTPDNGELLRALQGMQ